MATVSCKTYFTFGPAGDGRDKEREGEGGKLILKMSGTHFKPKIGGELVVDATFAVFVVILQHVLVVVVTEDTHQTSAIPVISHSTAIVYVSCSVFQHLRKTYMCFLTLEKTPFCVPQCISSHEKHTLRALVYILVPLKAHILCVPMCF